MEAKCSLGQCLSTGVCHSKVSSQAHEQEMLFVPAGAAVDIDDAAGAKRPVHRLLSPTAAATNSGLSAESCHVLAIESTAAAIKHDTSTFCSHFTERAIGISIQALTHRRFLATCTSMSINTWQPSCLASSLCAGSMMRDDISEPPAPRMMPFM